MRTPSEDAELMALSGMAHNWRGCRGWGSAATCGNFATYDDKSCIAGYGICDKHQAEAVAYVKERNSPSVYLDFLEFPEVPHAKFIRRFYRLLTGES